MKKSAVLLPFLLAACALTASPAAPTPPPAQTTAAPAPTESVPSLVIDGFFDDWGGAPLAVDPAGDGGSSGIDFTTISAMHTATDIVILVDLGRAVNLQSEPALVLTVSAAGGPTLVYDLAGRRGAIDGETVYHEDIGLVAQPTVTSDRFEIALRLDAEPTGEPLFPAGVPVSISLADPNPGGDTAAAAYAWDHPALPVTPLLTDRPAGSVRIVSFNVLRDGVLDSRRTDYFGRILTALQPDVIAFQEVNNRAAGSVEAQVEEWLGGDWFARKQADLVTVSRFPFIDDWTENFRPLDERIYAQMVDIAGQPLIVFNGHLFCCDADEGRQEQADGFAAFNRDHVPAGTPFILVGDLNLVGDAAQLHTLLTGDILDEAGYGSDHAPDFDGTPLADLVPRHLYSAQTYTWWDAGSDFAPGRLDYAIYTDSLLEATGFVFDPSELPDELLAALGVEAGDAVGASDHLPVVVDILR